ncbi:MAG: outer membrane beta-barrel protein [candidate division Zixibacteria bacterium]|nr:outer membrane beta-barrel protein [candidate division Zixibacteria bacterium]
MKKTLLTIVALFIFSSLAMAQIPSSPISFYGGGALSVPSSPSGFSDGWKTGYHGFAGVGFSVAPKMKIVGKVEYHSFASDFGITNLDGGAMKVLMFGPEAQLSLGAPMVPIKPFLSAGVGMASVSFADFTGTDPLVAALNTANSGASSTNFFYSIGGGLEFSIGPTASFFVQARYATISGDGGSTSFLPISVGLKIF